MSYKYTYVDQNGQPALKCPACGADWTADYSLTLGVSCGERVLEFLTCLEKESGRLFDVDHLVENGYHSFTECADCGAQLCDLEGIVEDIERI